MEAPTPTTILDEIYQRLLKRPFNIFGNSVWREGDDVPDWFGINCIDAAKIIIEETRRRVGGKCTVYGDTSSWHCTTLWQPEESGESRTRYLLDPIMWMKNPVHLRSDFEFVDSYPKINGYHSKTEIETDEKHLKTTWFRADRPERPYIHCYDLKQPKYLVEYSHPEMIKTTLSLERLVMRTITDDGFREIKIPVEKRKRDCHIRINGNGSRLNAHQDGKNFDQAYEELMEILKTTPPEFQEVMELFFARLDALKKP